MRSGARRRGGLRRAALHLGGTVGVAMPLLGLLAIWGLHAFTRTGERAHEADYRAALNFQLTLLVAGLVNGGLLLLALHAAPEMVAPVLVVTVLLAASAVAVPLLAFALALVALPFPYPALPFVRERRMRPGGGMAVW